MNPVILMILGGVVAIGSFIFAAFNMAHLGGKKSAGGLISENFGAMIGIVVGGVIFWAGMIWGIVLLVKMLAAG